MRRVWAAVLSVWATLSIVGVLAWSHAAPKPAAVAGPQAVVLAQGGGVTTSGSSKVASQPAAAGTQLVAATGAQPQVVSGGS